MKKRAGQQREAPSKVLLVCVYDTVVVEVSNEAVFARFSAFGPIGKILIFEKGEVTKFFLEFLQVEDAAKAKSFLDGARLYDTICKMNIYFSNFATVDLKHETTEGLSLDAAYVPPYPYAPFYYPIQTYYPSLYSAAHHDQFATLADGFQALYLEPPSHPISFYSPSSEQAEYETAPEGPEKLEETIESNIDWLLRSEEKKADRSEERRPEKEVREQKQAGQGSCFLTFELQSDLPNRSVYNLFSNFGNVSYIKKTKRAVFIKFRTPEFAAMARNYLLGHSFLDNALALASLANPAEAAPREDEYAEVTYYDASFDRFTAQKSITINPPSSTLHVSSLRRESCRQENLKYLFEEFGEVEGVEVLGSADKGMALVKFRRIQDSFYALAEMHNRPLQGRKVQLSFTKSRLY